MPCNKIDKPLVVYRFRECYDFHNNVAYIITKESLFMQDRDFKVILMA